MDCEQFDHHVLDALYGELDELTTADLLRHVEGCSRCKDAYAGLRATRDVGVLPLLEPSQGLEARILDAVRGAQAKTPWPRKVLRALTWAGSHAMRPQLAMAAVFSLVVGSSMLLLRARPGTSGMVPLRVTEHGSPAADPDGFGTSPSPHDLNPYAAPKGMRAAAAHALPEGELGLATARPEASASTADAGGDPRAALADARATRTASGCAPAITKYDAVVVRFRGSQAAADAMWDEATCFTQLGQNERARELYRSLASTSYGERARKNLDDPSPPELRSPAAPQDAASASRMPARPKQP